MNFLFTFDGPDASGKTLISALVVEELRMKFKPKGYTVISGRMPGGTPAGTEIRKLLKNPAVTISPITERLLFAADTAEFFHQTLAEMNSIEKTIHIIDRWSPITEYMYGIPRGVTTDQLNSVIKIYMNRQLALMPDLLFIVDVRKEHMMDRLKAAMRPACRIERLGESYHAKIWELYYRAASDDSSDARKHCLLLAHDVLRLDNTRPEFITPREVADEAIRQIEGLIEKKVGGCS